MKVSIIFFPGLSKVKNKSGKIPLFLRIVYNRQKAEARLKSEILSNEFNKWNARTMRMDERNSLINQELNNIENDFQRFSDQNNSMTMINAKSIRDFLIGRNKPENISILTYAMNYYSGTVASNNDLSEGTKKNYRKALNHLKNFLSLSKYENLMLSSIDYSFAIRFKDYLINASPENKREGMTEVSASGNIKKFRTIFDRAVCEGLMKDNPFKKIKLKTKSPYRDKLIISQARTLFLTDLKNCPVLDISRDIFLFCLFTGLAYNDAVSLSASNLIFLNDNEILLRIKRTKTNEPTESILTSFALQIIDKYKKHPDCLIRNKILPKRSNKDLNLHLRVIAEKCELNLKLTSHIGRHSFRQLLSEAGIEDDGVIKRMMGHSRKGTIDDIYYNITESRLIAAKIKFENYLKTYLYAD